MNEAEISGEQKRDLLRNVRKQRLKYIAILPSLITLINGICGFAAICFTSEGIEGNFELYKLDLPYFAVSGYLIFIAMIADMLDGRVARMSHSTSSFGGQLDSLCDIISFGVAPAFLVFNIMDYKLTTLVDPAPFFSGFLQRFIWLAAATYLVCAAIRLARFNVENEEDETAHMNFVGLPTPAAAGVIASLVVFYQDVLLEGVLQTVGHNSRIFSIGEGIIIYSLPFVTIGVAILMISRVRFPHFLNQYLKGRKPLTHIAWGLVVMFLILFFLQTALVVSFCGFAIFGYVKWILHKLKKSRSSGKGSGEPPVLSITNQPDSDE